MENVQEVLSNVAGTLNLKTLSWDAALRVAVLVLVGMAVIRVLMKLVDRLLNPRNRHPRTYWSQVEGRPSPRDLLPLERGGILIRD